MTNQPDAPVFRILRRYWPILLLAIVPLVPIWRAVFMGEAIGPFDQIRQMAPWNGSKPAQPWDVVQADGVLQFYVWRDLVFSAWGQGHIPFWNTYQLAGTPLLANSQSGGLYPPHVILGLLHVPTAIAMTLLAWFHLFWAGLGSYWLARRLGANRIGSSVAGVSFALSNFMIAWTGLPSVVETVAWIPWILAFITYLLGRDPNCRPRTFVWLGLCVAMMILAGHLQFVSYGFMAAAVLILYLGMVETSPLAGKPAFRPQIRPMILCLLGLVLGVILAAPQLLPVLKFSQFSQRRNSPTEAGYTANVSNAIQPYELIKLVAPSIEGNPRQPADGLPVSTYYPAVIHTGANFAESAIGLGALIVILFCLLPAVASKRHPVWGLTLVGLLAFLVAVGSPLNELLYFLLPGWSSTGSPGRVIVLFVLAACVAAGIAASNLGELKTEKRKLQISVGIFVGLIVVFALLKNGFDVPKGIDPAAIDQLKSQAESAAIPGAIGVLLISGLAVYLAIIEQSIRSQVALLAVPVLSCLAFFGMNLIQTGDPNLKVAHAPTTERIAAINQNWDLLVAQHATLPPNLAALSRIHSLDGYDSLLHRDSKALLQDIDGKDPAALANGNMLFIKPGADLRKLADAGVTQVWSQKEIPGLGPMTQSDGIYKYRLPGPGRASTPQETATIVSEDFDQMRIRATGPGKLTVRERNMPGWLAKVDGRHTTTSGQTWIEIDLPPGEHQIELNYVAPGFIEGLTVAFAGWLAVLLLAFVPKVLGLKSTKSS